MTALRIACVHSGSQKAKQSFTDLDGVYDFAAPEQSDIIVALGGDGLMLHTIHNSLQLGKPIFGMNCGTVGFLMNDFHTEDLLSRIESAKEIRGSAGHKPTQYQINELNSPILVR